VPNPLIRRRLGGPGGGPEQALAANFSNGATQALTIASNASLQLNGTDWTIVGFVKFTTTTNYRKVVVKQASDSVFEYGIQLNPTGAAGNPGLQAFTTGGNAQSATVLAAGTWYWFWADFALASTTLSLSINNAAPASASVAAPSAGAGTFGIGYFGGATTAYAMDGGIEAVGLWKRLLTAGEKTAIYNAGAGVVMGKLAGAYLTNMVSVYDFNTASNLGLDRHGTNTLANVNGVTAVPGLT